LEIIPRIKEFPHDGRTWRVDWFGAVEKNHNVPSEPTIEVIISPLRQSDSKLASVSAVDDNERIVIRIGVGQLPFIVIGSLWTDGYCQQEKAGGIERFTNIDVNKSTVQMIKSGHKLNDETLVPYKFYRLGGSGLNANCLAISNDNDPFNIIIPVAEVIRFYYATSTDMAHALFYGDFKHNLNSILNQKKSGINREQKRYFLKLRQNFSDNDAWTIGRILCSPEAYSGATRIHDSISRNSINRRVRNYPETAFPFSGTTSIRARTKRIQSDGKWRHLVFEIEHCTGTFPFEHLFCHRDNDNSIADHETDIPDEEKKPAFKRRKEDYDPEKHEVQSDEEPSRYQSTVVISNPKNRFGVITNKELEKPSKKTKNLYKSTLVEPLVESPSGELGTGKGNYSDSGCGTLRGNIKKTRSKALSADLSTFIHHIECLNNKENITASIRQPSDQIGFVPLTKPSDKRQWSYLDSKHKFHRRVLVADIIKSGKYYAVIEFETRSSERFKLALLSLTDGKVLSDSHIAQILMSMAQKQGRWENIVNLPLGVIMYTMKHTWSSSPACATAILTQITKATSKKEKSTTVNAI